MDNTEDDIDDGEFNSLWMMLDDENDEDKKDDEVNDEDDENVGDARCISREYVEVKLKYIIIRTE